MSFVTAKGKVPASRYLTASRWQYILLLLLMSLLSDTVWAKSAGMNGQDSEFQKFFLAGGWLVWAVLLPLSVVTVSLIVQFCLMLRRNRQFPPVVIKNLPRLMAHAHSNQAVDFLKRKDSFLSRILLSGLAELPNGREAMESAMMDKIEQDATALLRKIEWLNIIGNVAPMIGLFGTVWGMIDAFEGIVLAGGQPEPADLAGGISTALVTTWWGLVVAIPALAVYGFLRNRIDAQAAESTVIAEQLLLHGQNE